MRRLFLTVIKTCFAVIAAFPLMIVGCSPFIIQVAPSSRPTAASPLSTVKPPLKILVPEFTDSRVLRTPENHVFFTTFGSAITPGRVITTESIGASMTELVRDELRRSGHDVLESAEDQVDVILEGSILEYHAFFDMRSLRPQDELSGHVKVDITLRTAPEGTPLLNKSYQGFYIERRYQLGSNASPIKNALDRALLDMLEELIADEDLLRVLSAVAKK
jgi:hypothetical protein